MRNVELFWKNFLRRPLDVIIPLIMSALFILLFVAESSATVLSANIVTDSVALVSSPKCNAEILIYKRSNAAKYSQDCYHAALGADECNFFYNQSVHYTTKFNNSCPFPEETCTLGGNSGFTFDTGLINVKVLGLNFPDQY